MIALLADYPRMVKPLKVLAVRPRQTAADLNFKRTRLLCRHCQEYHEFGKADLYVVGNEAGEFRRS